MKGVKYAVVELPVCDDQTDVTSQVGGLSDTDLEKAVIERPECYATSKDGGMGDTGTERRQCSRQDDTADKDNTAIGKGLSVCDHNADRMGNAVMMERQ